ncbi:uncharacterized protein LY89DRAFT_743412 [Mollisia scopiformis]|uniref:Uncharacterized protein n=1 Tax=Mollisia scopiformis TaxID=149040 RepID=A0A132B360_MOLSC|nr:uncharacterized protein LY89DRAFT_743412 [Mollisia scopiformis]KUJ06771.1 hypothetical protein LY89DRAFT_743412 [Mollisia scopiformis]
MFTGFVCFVEIGPLPLDVKYLLNEFMFDTSTADCLNVLPWRMGSQREPGVVFQVKGPTTFILIRKDEPPAEGFSSPSGGVLPVSVVLTLRPMEWLRVPGRLGKVANPYERHSKRGSWEVEITNPKGPKRRYAPIDVAPEDVPGDLKIRVQKEPSDGDEIGRYLNNLRDGDIVMVTGPIREEKNVAKT